MVSKDLPSRVSLISTTLAAGWAKLPLLVGCVRQALEEDGCQEVARRVGTHLLGRLSALRDKHRCVGDVRGKGLMLGLELVADRESRVPLDAATVADVWEHTKDCGLLVGKGGHFGNVRTERHARVTR